MWAVTGWAVATWLKITVFLALGVGAAWLWCSPGWFAVVVIAAVLVELWAIRQLAASGPTKRARPGGGHRDHGRAGGRAARPVRPPDQPARDPGQRPPSRIESNDVDLMVTVAANAVRCGYLLVGAAERVYARTDADDASPGSRATRKTPCTNSCGGAGSPSAPPTASPAAPRT